MKKLVFICSPLAPYNNYTLQDNINFAKERCRELVLEGYSVIAPHVFFTQFLDDTILEERKLGFECGLTFLKFCDKVYVIQRDNYISRGMKEEIKLAKEWNKEIENWYIYTSSFKMKGE